MVEDCSLLQVAAIDLSWEFLMEKRGDLDGHMYRELIYCVNIYLNI